MADIIESIPEEGSPILVVDDDVGMLSSMEATLCSFGLPRPALVSDGRRVNALIEKHGFQVVVLDILMPGVNGLDVLKAVKSEYPDTRCIMVTAVDRVDKAVEAMQFGALDYLVKPIEREKLHSVVRAALQPAGEADAGDADLRRFESQIQNTQKMAAIGALACGIAHDFNNMLTPIMGYAELALEDLPEESNILYNLRQILSAAGRAKRLVKQILIFNRTRDQKKEAAEIQHIVREALTFLKQTLPASATVRESIQNCAPALVDPAQIHQLVMNLCINAFHALPEQKGTIDVALENVRLDAADETVRPPVPPGDYVRLVVKDDGCGVSPDAMEKIFEPYFTTKPPDKGTGLGLSIVRGIVKNHRGHIRVDSRPGDGAAFFVYLPVAAQRPGETVTIADEPAPTGTERILIVDDDGPGLKLLSKMMASLGYAVTARASAPDALETFQAAPDAYDLVVTDMTMPVMNGVKLTQEIRRIRPDAPVILMSGFSELVNEKNYQKAGVSAFVAKPVLKAELARAVRDALTRKSSFQ